jgi:hypothetical protein
MMLTKAWPPLLVVIGIFVFAGGSAHATLSYVHPSGSGDVGCPQDPFSCMDSFAPTGFSIQSGAGVVTDLSYLTDGSSDGTSTTYTYFDLFNINGINPGTTVTFTFSSMATYTYALAHMNISGCDLDSLGNPGVFSSDSFNLGLPCTNASSDGSVFFKETDNSGAFQIQLNFSCSSDPTVSNSCTAFPTSYTPGNALDGSSSLDWGFIVSDNVNGKGLGTPSSVSLSAGSVTAPEPNSLSMLALGLLALGVLSLKKLQTI